MICQECKAHHWCIINSRARRPNPLPYGFPDQSSIMNHHIPLDSPLLPNPVVKSERRTVRNRSFEETSFQTAPPELVLTGPVADNWFDH